MNKGTFWGKMKNVVGKVCPVLHMNMLFWNRGNAS